MDRGLYVGDDHTSAVSPSAGIQIATGGTNGFVVGSGTLPSPIGMADFSGKSPMVGIMLDATGTAGAHSARPSNSLVFRATDAGPASHDWKVYQETDRTLPFSLDNSNVFVVGAGNLGIGTTSPRNILTVVHGSATRPIADAWTTYSSRRLKTNIQPIEGALEKVERLRGVYFDWTGSSKHDVGLIAEEVGEVVPEVVAYEKNGRDATTLDYSRLTALLIEAVKDQETEIKQLKSEIQRLDAQLHDGTQMARK